MKYKISKKARICRHFFRIKLNKYKQQFPTLPQSSLVSKILAEWEAFSNEEIEQLKRNFIVAVGEDFLRDTSESENEVQEEINKKSQKFKKLKVEREPKVRLFIEEETIDQDFFDDESSNEIFVEPKITSIKIRKNSKESEYLKFYKYFDEKLSEEFEKWDFEKRKKIIKLLWKKKNSKKKTIASKNKFKIQNCRNLGEIKSMSIKKLKKKIPKSYKINYDLIFECLTKKEHEIKILIENNNFTKKTEEKYWKAIKIAIKSFNKKTRIN